MVPSKVLTTLVELAGEVNSGSGITRVKSRNMGARERRGMRMIVNTSGEAEPRSTIRNTNDVTGRRGVAVGGAQGRTKTVRAQPVRGAQLSGFQTRRKDASWKEGWT